MTLPVHQQQWLLSPKTCLILRVFVALTQLIEKGISKHKAQPQRGGMFIETLSGPDDKFPRGATCV